MHLQTSTKKSFSALELQKQLGHKYYEPIWGMLHKLRLAMGHRDNKYLLEKDIELDEGFFTTILPQEEQEKPLKRGRGSQRKTKVLVMVESEKVKEPQDPNKPKRVGHIKMVVIDDLKAETIDKVVKKSVVKNSELETDNSTSYTNIKEYVAKHNAQVISPKEVGKVLPWVHIAISNAKRMLLDIHHDIKSGFLQSYLNEFCYKFNRRYFGEKLFERLVIAIISNKNQFRYRIR